MTNEEKILERLDELSQEIKDAKKAIKPYIELKEDLQPIINEIFQESIQRFEGLGRNFNVEDVADMIGQLLASSKNLSEAMKSLNRFMDFKNDFTPLFKEMFAESVQILDIPGNGFHLTDLQQVTKEFLLNLKNIAEMLKMVNSAMEFKNDFAGLAKPAFNEIVQRLDNLKQKGVFNAFEELLAILERVGDKLTEIDFNNVKPVKGIMGLMKALKKPEVQEGLGILIEMTKVIPAIKKPS